MELKELMAIDNARGYFEFYVVSVLLLPDNKFI